MPKGKRNKGTRVSNNLMPTTNTATVKTYAVSITPEDAQLLEKAKKSIVDSELDLQELRKMMEDNLQAEIDAMRKIMEEELLKEQEENKKSFEKKLKETNNELVAKNEEFATNNASLERQIEIAKKECETARIEKQIVLDKANSEAEAIVKKAKEEAEVQNKKALEEIEEIKSELKEKQEEIEDKELELEMRETTLSGKEKRIKKRETLYETANPDAVASLERQLVLRAEQLEDVQVEFEKAQSELNKIRISQIKAEGISPEELQRVNEQLMERVEVLENKCNRYTDYELIEMKRALEQEGERLTQIRNLEIEVSERRAELERLNNSILEYEQLKAQLDLLRTLNDHLRSELDNTKRMLESSVGEICPALTSIDIDETSDSGDSYNKYIKRRDSKNSGEQIKALSDLVSHVRLYAASREKPLYYSDEDLRAFIAGMASSPLGILQGMSGTGKTSLPKIFAEATMGEISVVAVESSWRDRNELLGYYNDFSKKFTAKGFTCDLYRAGSSRYADAPYFIVLDEMNLSRVEYYFADFLSILEDKKENWKIKLLDTDMRQLPTEITKEVKDALKKDKSDEASELFELVEKLYPEMTLSDEKEVQATSNDKLRLITYLSNHKFKNSAKTRNLVGGPQNLIGGNTIRIPRNVWFIGTANKDESTFEITDKVYDRAQVLNFNKRAVGEKHGTEMEPVFVTYEQIKKLFNKAVNDKANTFRVETNALLQEIEQILRLNFRISFGNRIQDQMNTFVPVYVAAGKKSRISEEELKQLENEAIDYQLTNKVLRKLEYVEMNKEASEKLRKIFEKNGLALAKEFIDWKLRGAE